MRDCLGRSCTSRWGVSRSAVQIAEGLHPGPDHLRVGLPALMIALMGEPRTRPSLRTARIRPNHRQLTRIDSRKGRDRNEVRLRPHSHRRRATPAEHRPVERTGDFHRSFDVFGTDALDGELLSRGVGASCPFSRRSLTYRVDRRSRFLEVRKSHLAVSMPRTAQESGKRCRGYPSSSCNPGRRRGTARATPRTRSLRTSAGPPLGQCPSERRGHLATRSFRLRPDHNTSRYDRPKSDHEIASAIWKTRVWHGICYTETWAKDFPRVQPRVYR